MTRFFVCAAVVGLTLLFAGSSTAQEVVDGGFEPGTGLYPFARTCNVNPYLPGQWNQEAAQIVAGPSGSISPRAGDGMLRMNSSCTVSQVNQIIALPSPPPSNLTYSIYVNAAQAATVSLRVGFGDGQTCVGTLTNETVETVAFDMDADPATWERVELTRTVPASSAFARVESFSSCSQHPAGGLFFDDASAEIPVAAGITGFADLHVHQFTNEAMAGAWLYGSPTGPPETALARCHGNLNLLGPGHGEVDHALAWALLGPVGSVIVQAAQGGDRGLHAGRRHGYCVEKTTPGIGLCRGNFACDLLSQSKCSSNVCEWRSIGNLCRDKPGDGISVGTGCNLTSLSNCANSCSWSWPVCKGNTACNLLSFNKSKCVSSSVCSVQSIGSICRDKDGDGKSVGLACNTVGAAKCEATCSWDASWGAVTLHGEKRAHDYTDGNTRSPDEASWPAWDVRAHQQVHEDWLFEAYQDGLRLMVMSAINNEFLCDMMPWANRGTGYGCSDAENVTRQLDAAKALAAGASWYEIAETATEAISIIQQNKLAVILSVEASDIFNTADPLAALQSLYDDGASTLQPVHQFNSKLGGVATHDPMIKIAQTIKNLPSLDHLCKDNGGTGTFAKCDATLDNLNYLGLKNAGRQFIAKMMNLGMPIDIAHMSEHSVHDVAEIVGAACNYPVYISHGHVRDLIDSDSFRATKRDEKTIPQWQIELVRSTGGIIGLRTGADYYVFSSYDSSMTAAGLSTTVPSRGPVAVKGKTADRGGNQFHFGYAVDYLSRAEEVNVALGSDLNGLIEQMLFEDEHWDRKMSGLAHIGRLPDMFTRLQQTGIDTASYTALHDDSAANYIQMWARAEAFANGQSCCPNPTASGVVPAQAWAGRENRVMIVGEGFTPHETLEVTLRDAPLSPGIACSDVEFVSGSEVVCTLPILASDTSYEVTVRNDGCGLEATMPNAYFASSTDTGPVPPPIPPDPPFTQADYMTVLADPIPANGYATPNAAKIAAVDWTHPAWLGLSELDFYEAGDRPFEDGYSQPDWEASETSPDRGPISAFLLGLLGIEDAASLTDPMTMLEACDMDDTERAQLAASEGWPGDWRQQLATLCSDGGEGGSLPVPAVGTFGLVGFIVALLGVGGLLASRRAGAGPRPRS